MVDAKDIGIECFEPFDEVERFGGPEIGGKRGAVGHGSGEEGEDGSDFLRGYVDGFQKGH